MPTGHPAKRRVLLPALLSLIVVVAATAVLVGAGQRSWSTQPKVTWAPPSVTETILAGGSQTVRVSVTASQDLRDVVLQVVPELQRFVHVSPASFGTLAAGQGAVVEITFSAPPDSSPAALEGTIHLRSGTGRYQTTFAKPLPVSIRIEWPVFQNPELGVQFSYPAFGQPSRVEVIPIDEATTRADINTYSPSSDAFVSQLGMTLIKNSAGLSLLDWFARNVDLSGTLVSSGTFVPESFGNGIQALVAADRIPSEHLDMNGPVAQIYAISPSGNTVVALTLSQVNELDLWGFPPGGQLELLKAIIRSMTLP